MFLRGDYPILTDPMETDFYKYPMGQAQLHHFPGVRLKWAFINRSKNIRLAERISMRHLQEELEHAFSLKHGNSALHYLRGTNEYTERMFQEDYLNSLREAPVVDWTLGVKDGQFDMSVDGLWTDSTRCELPVLQVMNALHTDYQYRLLTRAERIHVRAEAMARLRHKIELLKLRPDITFSDFGNRRAASPEWHDEVVRVLKEDLPSQQFLGTSNTYLAQKYNLMPIGTSAHELYMALSALHQDLAQSQRAVLDMWWQEYGQGLSITLPDTYGTDFFLEKVITPEQARLWKGSRQDSGDPIVYGEKWIAFYKHHGIDPRDKMIIFSDGLTIEEIFRIADHFKGRIRVTFGWGTNLTNDLPGLQTLSIVMKPVEVTFKRDGQIFCVALSKLSDNIAKATGGQKAIERDIVRAGYSNTFSAACTY